VDDHRHGGFPCACPRRPRPRGEKPSLPQGPAAHQPPKSPRRPRKTPRRHAFGVTVSDSIRTYIRAEHGLGATTQTSIEFLESIRSNPVFTENEKEGLEAFLNRTDLLKFARTAAGEAELLGLLDIAARLVRGEAQSAKPAQPTQPGKPA
jgi:hypothetical protein